MAEFVHRKELSVTYMPDSGKPSIKVPFQLSDGTIINIYIDREEVIELNRIYQLNVDFFNQKNWGL